MEVSVGGSFPFLSFLSNEELLIVVQNSGTGMTMRRVGTSLY